MLEIILIVIAASVLLAIFFVLYMKRVPHGWVQFRTGLVLRFLPPLDKFPVVKLRESMEQFILKRLPKIKKELPVENVSDLKIPTRHGEIGARLFHNDLNESMDLLVLIHGGGYCIGSLNTYEEVSRRLVRATGLPLISLDYSLAPENKFPKGHEECLDAVSWVVKNCEKLINFTVPVILIGDSAGGNLILSTLYECSSDIRKSIKKIIPVYPAADSRKTNYRSAREFAQGYYLTQKAMAQFTEGLLSSEGQLDDIRLSPLHYPSLTDCPDVFVITAEFDPLRDQGEALAAKLKAEGHSVILKRYPGTIHAFFGLKDFGSKGLEAIEDIDKFIKGQKIDETQFIKENLISEPSERN